MANLAPEIALRYLLTTSTPVSALIASRIFPNAASELAVFPYVTYSLIAHQREGHLLGPSGLVFRRYQFDIFAKTNAEVGLIIDAIRNRLDGYVGLVTIGADSLRLQNVELLDQSDGYVESTDGSDTGIFKRSIDFRVSLGETIPTHL
jgi:hypothetical protein